MFFMKKLKKHHFTHIDPEIKSDSNKKVGDISEDSSSKKGIDNYDVIKKDLKRTTFTIGIFVLLVVIFYVLSQKTDILNEVISKLGI